MDVLKLEGVVVQKNVNLALGILLLPVVTVAGTVGVYMIPESGGWPGYHHGHVKDVKDLKGLRTGIKECIKKKNINKQGEFTFMGKCYTEGYLVIDAKSEADCLTILTALRGRRLKVHASLQDLLDHQFVQVDSFQSHLTIPSVEFFVVDELEDD